MGVEIGIVFDVDRNTLAHPAAQRIDDLVLEDRQHPGPQRRARGEGFAALQRRHQRFLDGILGLRPVAQLHFGKAQHVAAEAGEELGVAQWVCRHVDSR